MSIELSNEILMMLDKIVDKYEDDTLKITDRPTMISGMIMRLYHNLNLEDENKGDEKYEN